MIWRYPTAIFLLFWNVLTHRCFHFCTFTASTACSALLCSDFLKAFSLLLFRDAHDIQRSESLYFSLLQIRTVDLKISLIFNVLFYFTFFNFLGLKYWDRGCDAYCQKIIFLRPPILTSLHTVYYFPQEYFITYRVEYKPLSNVNRIRM